jgi:NAD(P)-dependent dehydrogenase (short-subunit alcohol dehydrogenase family)
MVARFTERWPEWQAKTNESYPPGRIATPQACLVINSHTTTHAQEVNALFWQEVANAIVFLSKGDVCGFLNGHVLAIDGGALCT